MKKEELKKWLGHFDSEIENAPWPVVNSIALPSAQAACEMLNQKIQEGWERLTKSMQDSGIPASSITFGGTPGEQVMSVDGEPIFGMKLKFINNCVCIDFYPMPAISLPGRA
jgi:hypothetical protein